MLARIATKARRALGAFGLLAAAALAQTGPVTLDTGFGDGGIALSSLRSGLDNPQAPVRDADGSYLTFSISEATGAVSQLNVARVLPDGALDPAFGDDGVATLFPHNGVIHPGALTLDGAGRILIAYTTDGDCNFLDVIRLSPEGALDTGFGDAGRVRLDPSDIEFDTCGFPTSQGIAWNGASGVDYRIGLAATSSDDPGNAFHGTLVQLLENGDPDPAFGGDGVVQLAVGTASTFRGLLYSGNRLYAWGSRTTATGTDMLLARFIATDGTPDTLFGHNGAFGPGYLVSDVGGDSVAWALQEANCPAIGGGCFYVAGSTVVGGLRQALVARYVAFISGCSTRGGTTPCLHTGAGAFDGDGFATLDLEPLGEEEAFSLAVRPAPQSVTISGTRNFSGLAFAARYLEDGSPDAALAGDGVLDDVFGFDLDTRAWLIGEDAQGFVVLGRGLTGSARDTVLARRLFDGTPHPSFGSAGIARHFLTGAFSGGADMIVDGSGRPVVVGSSRNAVDNRNEMGVVRFTPGGQRDATFDGDGQRRVFRAGDSFAEPYGVAAQADGKLVIVGLTQDGNPERLAIVRLTEQGSVDIGFASNGWFRLEGVGPRNEGRDVLVDAGGRIVALGHVQTAGPNDLVVVRLDANGSPDPSFNFSGVGYSIIPLPGTGEMAVEIRPHPLGGYAVLGNYSDGSGTRVLLARLNDSGVPLIMSIDTMIATSVTPRALALDAAGFWYVGGNTPSFSPLIARFDPNGLLDSAWGVGGLASFAGQLGWIDALDVDASGRPLASGTGVVGSQLDFMTYRVLANGGGSDPDFNGTGRVSVPMFPTGVATGQALGADGSVLVGGLGQARMAVAKFATRAASSVSLGVDVNPSQYNQGVTFTATASGAAGTPTGSVELFDGATSLGSAPLVAGVATIARSDLEVGNYNVVASYSGDGSYAPSASAPALPFAVGRAGTTATLANLDADGNTASGENVSFDMDASGAFGTVPSGNVELFVDNASFGTFPLSSGGFTLTTDDLPPGTHTLHAVYNGDSRHLPSPPSSSVMHTVGLAASGTSLDVAPASSFFGQDVTLTAQVGGQSGLPLTGNVEFRDGGALIATVAVSNGSAVHTTNTLTVGSHAFRAIYLGSASYSGSQSAQVDHAVSLRTSSTALQVMPSPSSTAGQNVTMIANVTGDPGAPVTGSVEFRDDTTVLATVALSNGQASFQTTALGVGGHPLRAVYLGSATYTGSSSPIVDHAVGVLASSTSLMVTPTPSSTVGQNVTLDATVTGQNASAVTGNVEFRDGATVLGTVALASGQAALVTSALALGSHTLRAVYLGDGTHAGSNSADVPHAVVVLDPHIFANGFEGPP